MPTIWAVVKIFQGVISSVSLHVDEMAADRDLMDYLGAPDGMSYERWAQMRDREVEPADWYRDCFADCTIMQADVCFELLACVGEASA